MMQGGGDEVSIGELASNLSTYKEQLHQMLPCFWFRSVNFWQMIVKILNMRTWIRSSKRYDATIEAFTPNGYYVSYDEWGNKEEVDPANVRSVQYDVLQEAERVAEATKQAIKRKIAQASSVGFQSRSLLAELHIEPDDPEDVKAAKRKKIHSFKSKMRMEQVEVTQNKRQNAWQQFQTTKGRAKKIGFLSGHKRESIFKSPDDPQDKVGVTGSGKGLTEFQRREKHLHLKGGGNEQTDE